LGIPVDLSWVNFEQDLTAFRTFRIKFSFVWWIFADFLLKRPFQPEIGKKTTTQL